MVDVSLLRADQTNCCPHCPTGVMACYASRIDRDAMVRLRYRKCKVCGTQGTPMIVPLQFAPTQPRRANVLSISDTDLCTYCDAGSLRTYSTRVDPMIGMRIRYRKCTRCGHHPKPLMVPNVDKSCPKCNDRMRVYSTRLVEELGMRMQYRKCKGCKFLQRSILAKLINAPIRTKRRQDRGVPFRITL